MPVRRVVDKQVNVGLLKETPVERIVEKPYNVQKYVEKIVNKQVQVPIVVSQSIDIPTVKVVEELVEVIEEVLVPVFTEVDRQVEIPYFTERVVEENIELEYPTERIVEVPVVVDKNVEVDVIREVAVEKPTSRVVDRKVELTTTRDKPIYNNKINDIISQKEVERTTRIITQVPRETVNEVFVDKLIDVNRHVQVARNVVRTNRKVLNKSVRKSVLSGAQRSEFQSVSKHLNDLKVDNIKLSVEIEVMNNQLREWRPFVSTHDYNSEKTRLQNSIRTTQSEISTLNSEIVQLESQTRVVTQQEVIEVYSSQEIAELEREIALIESKNQELMSIIGQIGVTTTNVTEGRVTYLEDPHPPMLTNTGYKQVTTTTSSNYKPTTNVTYSKDPLPPMLTNTGYKQVTTTTSTNYKPTTVIKTGKLTTQVKAPETRYY